MRARPLLLALLVFGLWLAWPRPIAPLELLVGFVAGSIVVLLGLAAARAVGRDAPILDGSVAPAVAFRRAGLALALGASCGAVVLLVLVYGLVPIEPALAARLRARAGAPLWMPWALAAEASILEELVLRLFLLSVLICLFTRAWRGSPSRVPWRVSASAIAATALLFGVMHLPAWLAVTEPTLFLVGSVLVLNGLGGLLFGTLYWTWGIEAAILAHFAADVVLQVVGPRLVGG